MNWLLSPDPTVPGSILQPAMESPGAVRAQAVVMLAPSSPKKKPLGGTEVGCGSQHQAGDIY